MVNALLCEVKCSVIRDLSRGKPLIPLFRKSRGIGDSDTLKRILDRFEIASENMLSLAEVRA